MKPDARLPVKDSRNRLDQRSWVRMVARTHADVLEGQLACLLYDQRSALLPGVALETALAKSLHDRAGIGEPDVRAHGQHRGALQPGQLVRLPRVIGEDRHVVRKGHLLGEM